MRVTEDQKNFAVKKPPSGKVKKKAPKGGEVGMFGIPRRTSVP